MSPSGLIGVGILGAGPVTQAIHLPTLARLTDIFRVVTVMDVDADIARSVAARVGARHTSDMGVLLDDPEVEVVVICSPHQFHADQVIAACRAGKKAVLCEKPFATTSEQAQAIATVSAETGVAVLVGAMHTFDPGWLAAKSNWGDLTQTAHFIRSSIVLPPNPRFEDFATEVISRPAGGSPDFNDPKVVAALINGGVMGLAIHDLPLVRTFLPHFEQVEVLSADVERPFGYSIVLRSGDRLVELHALMSSSWAPNWTLEVFADDQVARIEFTPSYVQAGSAVARLSTAGRTTTFGPADRNGYEGEWRQLAEVARGATPTTGSADLIADLTFALNIAELAEVKALESVSGVAS
jgi:myo-inositol 2-dehydrogenase/D-chiro-inositol 1-dehydrogenase